MALRVDRIHHLWYVHLHDRTNRRNISHQLPRRQQSLIRDLGISMACVQSSGYGLHLVWCSVLDRRSVSDNREKSESYLQNPKVNASR